MSGVTPAYGGLTFLNNSTILLGSSANSSQGAIQAIQVNRDGNGHITDFGAVTQYATAPNMDGGLAFGPGGVLFATGYGTNTLMQYLPGSTSPDKTITLDSATNSVGTVQFIGTGNPNAGSLIIGSYANNKWFIPTLTPDGNGTWDVTALTEVEASSGGVEGIVYVPTGSAGFTGAKGLVTHYDAGVIRAYDLNSFGAPVSGTGQDFVTGLTGAEGATIDPVTGDFLFSTFGGGNHIIQVQGFVPPASETPEPATFGVLGLSLVALGYRFRTRRS